MTTQYHHFFCTETALKYNKNETSWRVIQTGCMWNFKRQIRFSCKKCPNKWQQSSQSFGCSEVHEVSMDLRESLPSFCFNSSNLHVNITQASFLNHNIGMSDILDIQDIHSKGKRQIFDTLQKAKGIKYDCYWVRTISLENPTMFHRSMSYLNKKTRFNTMAFEHVSGASKRWLLCTWPRHKESPSSLWMFCDVWASEQTSQMEEKHDDLYKFSSATNHLYQVIQSDLSIPYLEVT